MTLRHKLSSVAVTAAICLIGQMCSPSISRAGATATATQLAFTTAAAGAAGGIPFTTQPVVTVEDSSNNAVTSSSAVVTLALSGGAPGASLTCTTNPVTASSGVASFAGCTIDKASTTAYTLTASTNGLTSATMQITVPPGPADKIVFTRTTTGGAGGVAWPTQPVITIEDKAGNTETGSTSRVALALAPGANGASLTCAAVNAVAGVATFSGCSIDTGGTYTLIATDGGDQKQAQLSGVAISANTRPATVSFTTPPGSGTGSTALPTQPVVSVKDAANNGVVASVTLALAGGTPGATLTCTANPVTTLSSGTATFAGCRVDKAGTGYYLNASVNSLSVASAPFDVTAGAANHLVFSTPPGGGTGGTALSAQPVVTVVDVAGNRVTTSTASIGLAVTAGTGAPGATLTCVATTVPAGGGNAAFDGCAIDRASATAYTLTATDSADSLSAISTPFTVNVGPASRLAFTAQPSGAVPATNFSGQPAVTVLDAGGNTVTSTPPAVTLSIGHGTGTAGAALTCASNPTTPGAGIATFSACRIDKAGTGYVLHAAASGTAGADSTSFSVATTPPPVTGVTPVVPLAQTFGGRDYGANPTLVTDDVNSATGSLFLSTTDLTVAGIGVPFSLTRSYNSADTAGGSFGPGWTSLFDAGVSVSAAGDKATVRAEDGQTLVFSSNGTGGWVAPPGARTSLACSGSNCTVTRFDGVTWHSAAGRIQDYLATSGQGLHLTYGANGVASVTVTTSSGPALTIAVTTNASGQVTAVTTPTRSTAYGYTNGRLTSFTDARGQVWTYGYDASGRLASQTDPLGHVRRTVTYAASGRVASSVTTGDPGRHDVTFSWDGATQTATRGVLQDVNGVATRVVFTDVYRGNVLISQRQPDGGHIDYAYDSTLELTQIKDPLGWVQQNTYSPAGDLITQSSPTSATTSAVSRKGYDTQHHVLSATDPNGHTTTFTYSGSQLVTMTPPGGPTFTYTYDSFGQATRSTTATGSRTFTYDRFGNPTSRQQLSPGGQILNGSGEQRVYDEAGNEVESVDPRGVVTGGAPNPAYVTTQSYGPTGLLLSKTQPGAVAKTTTYTYDNAGTLVSVTDPTGQVTTHSWNEATRTLTTSNPAGATSQSYDASGNVVSATDASGAVTISRYNNVGLKSASIDPTKVTTSFGYDLAERMVSANDSTGNTSTFTYDPLGRQTSKTTNGRTTTTSYDAASNVLSTRTPDGLVTSYTYDAMNRVASVTNPAGRTAYTYDGNGNVTRITDANNHLTNFAYDGADRLIAKVVNGATWTYSYDAGGNLTTTTDPDGRTTTYDINARNLVTGIHYRWTGHSNIDVSYQYDNLDRVTTMTDATGTHSYTYTANGSLASVTTGTNVFRYDYSTAGKRVVTYPDGTQVSYVSDDGGNLMSIAAGQAGQSGFVSASYVRNPAREAVSIAYSNGVATAQTWNVRGNIVDQTLSLRGTTVADTAYTYDGAGNRVSAATTFNGSTVTQSYGYDATGRLTAVGSASQTATTPTVPPAPVTAPTTPANASTSTGAPTFPAPVPGPAAGPGAQPPAGSPSYGYDGVGNRLSATTAAGTTTFAYNAADEITSQTGPTGSTTWTYDRSGNVTGENGP
ncbi:MAG TPA: DUF6531 domain-containing protein, partial [Acidimicrobiales bacterium]|nr:DUF6531 domain-containing protein [Acidimicrobiales bacterium]